jgi:hypothetical protein
MAWSCKRWMAYVLVLLVSLAAVSPAASATVEQWGDYGVPLTEDELSAVEGEWGPILVGAISGAVTGGFAYACGTDNPTVRGLVGSVASGAAFGALGGTLTTLRAVATGGSVAFRAADAAWGSWAGANVGALKGAVSHIVRRWK